KLDSAFERLRAIAPDVRLVAHRERLTAANAVEILDGYDLVLDGTDTFETRYAVADACAALGVPLAWGSVLGFDAQIAVSWPQAAGGAALRDLSPRRPPAGWVPTGGEAGVLGALTGQVGSTMATEAVKLITGVGEPLIGRVLVLDALRQRWTEVPLRARAEPAAQAPAAQPPAAPAAAAPVASPFARPEVPVIDAAELRALLEGDAPVTVLDVREPVEVAAGSIPGAV